MTQILPRFHRALEALADERKLARIALETSPDQPIQTTSRATLPGDTRRLRGIPVAGGACGTSPGTDPEQAVLRSMRR